MQYIYKIKPRHIFLLIPTIFFAVVLAVDLFSKKPLNDMYKSDFEPYYTTANLIRERKVKEIYKFDLKTQKTLSELKGNLSPEYILRYINFPAAALIYFPLTFFSFLTAYRIFFIINALIVLISVFLLFSKRPKNALFYLIYPLFLPLYGSIYFGQFSPLLFLALVLLFYALKEHKDLLAGLLCSLFILKFQYLTLVPFIFLLVRNKKRIFGKFFLVWLLSI